MGRREQMRFPRDADFFCPECSRVAVHPVPPEWSYESIAVWEGVATVCTYKTRVVGDTDRLVYKAPMS